MEDTQPAGRSLEHMPIPLFATVMGTAGLTLAWRAAEQAWGWSAAISTTLTAVVVLLFLFLSAAYSLKFIRYREAVKAEFHHPVKMNFFPAISISLVLVAMLLQPHVTWLAGLLWLGGAALHITFTLVVMGIWIGQRPFQIAHINPAWFIPVVGNVLMPLAGVPLGFVELSWFFFSVGVVFWLVLMTLMFYRFIFHDPLPERLLPTLAILLAPPAVGFLAWTHLNGGEINAMGRILYYTGAFIFLLLVLRARGFGRLPFFLSWWAYSFPVAAFAIATVTMAGMVPSTFLAIAGALLVLLTTVLVIALVVMTLKAARAGKICVPE
ncbi:SLAC1 anion channel family protein [Alkalilimnicola ehrlichii MLHE-1]|uniref:C4-dicarboxylate transporter/malic acid transport protein n=1 Tax=Alkalilimnicola ehrlichii (strain ATCC BAA-1101 / DSM 17681 / MLHE-1) TaxID=187272 RepID=Q0A963_ALKEH|nr:SLAC1 anion channel family protein [Alkalilimnicola ehrlichii]ABI56624.1 C4-dicarboxylate transporter/malic acid transport protein [Alkalilimnicola ehrlichii MLHE-1]